MLIYLRLLAVDLVKLKWITLLDSFTNYADKGNNIPLMDLGFDKKFALVLRKIENQHGCIKLVKSANGKNSKHSCKLEIITGQVTC